MKFFNWLQSGSSDEKSRYAFAFAGLITLFITVIWATTLPTRFLHMSDSLDGLTTNTAAVGDSVSDIIQNAQMQLPTPPDTTGIETGDPNLSALDQLTFDPDATSTATEISAVNGTSSFPADAIIITPPKGDEASQPVSQPATTTTPDSGTERIATSSQPQIILIATTSSQKTE